MANFILFFDEKEGTSPLVRLLDKFRQIQIVHQIHDRGWEPFDIHNCGPMSIRNMRSCLELIFSEPTVSMDKLNGIYTKSAARGLEPIGSDLSIGLKMRFVAPGVPLPFSRAPTQLSQLIGSVNSSAFKKMMYELISKNDVKVLIAVRQDILRWALSKYHGDGTGKSGHLQFRLASGKITRNEIGKIHVDCKKLSNIVEQCKKRHEEKRNLIEELRCIGVNSFTVRYEDFVDDKAAVLRSIAGEISVDITDEQIDEVLSAGTRLEKVHSNDISQFVVNHEEVTRKFENSYVEWL